MMYKVAFCLFFGAILIITSSASGKEQKGDIKITPVDVEKTTRVQIKSFGRYVEIKCPDDAVGHTPNSHNICFAGKGDSEDFIREFTDKMAVYLKENVYWRRDFGIWHTEMKFKNTAHSVVINIMAKGDASNLQSNPDMENRNLFIACAIFNQ